MTLEAQLNILAVEEAIGIFQAKFPNSDIHKLQIEHVGPYLKYEMVGMDDQHTNILEINAHTGGVLKERQKPLRKKALDPAWRQQKALNLTELLPLTDVNTIAQQKIADMEPFQWEMDRAKERTIWKIEFADPHGTQITEFKVDAQNGQVVQMKLK